MSDSETIKHIRELLLRGERLLDEHCPKCGTPLILIKETGLKYCPKCRVYIATEEELKKAKVDPKKLKVYDFDEYWKTKEKAGSEQTEAPIEHVEEKEKMKQKENSKEKKDITDSVISEDAIGELDNLISFMVTKIKEKIEKQDLTLEQMVDLLNRIVQLKKQI